MIDVYPLLEEKGGTKRFSNCDYDTLLERADTPSLANTRISNMMMCILKCINLINYPEYLKEVFQFSTTEYSLRGTNVLVWPNPKHLHIALTQLEMPHQKGGGGGRVLPYKRLMGRCRWMGSHFQ